MKKLKGGGLYIAISSNGKFMMTTGQNKVYVHSLPDCKNTDTLKTSLSNVTSAAMSHDCKMVVAKNTSGAIALLEYPSGRIIGASKMEKKEGYHSICFSVDDMYILDFDWEGNIMRIEVPSASASEAVQLKHSVIFKATDEMYTYDDYRSGVLTHIGYDEAKNELFAIGAGWIYTSPMGEIDFIPKAENGTRWATYFIGKDHNVLHVERTSLVYDKNWNLVKRFVRNSYSLHAQSAQNDSCLNDDSWYNDKRNLVRNIAISDNGDMLAILTSADIAYIYRLDNPEPVRVLIGGVSIPSPRSARFINDDTMLALTGWSGTVVVELDL